jgi:murein DD-endopeptidase MepM/ murein hydrolase activator NlpD
VLAGLLAALALASAAVAEAPHLVLDGPLIQGGLVVGRALAGARVALDGKPVRVAPNGTFLIGFGRDAKAGWTLRIAWPEGRTEMRTLAVEPRAYEVQRIDGLPQRMVSPDAEALERIRAENAMIAKARATDTPQTWFRGGFVWPARGPISGVYGSRRILNGEPRRPHYGVDIAAPRGAPVVAPAAGRVTLAHADMYYTGKTLILDHGHGLTSAFLHMDELTVEEGDFVRQGEAIGTVGATGRATGAHLDWRMNLFAVRIDPALIVGPMPETQAGAR